MFKGRKASQNIIARQQQGEGCEREHERPGERHQVQEESDRVIDGEVACELVFRPDKYAREIQGIPAA